MECRRSRRTIVLAISMVLLLNASQYVSAEIPHENFDLVGTDLDMVVQMFDQGINATELALISCIDGRPANGSSNLTHLDSILVPATKLISQIQDIANSYDNLSYLIPPFNNLSSGGHRFIANQSVFLNDFYVMRGYVGKPLSVSQLAEARHSISEAVIAIFSMNTNLDTMDQAASAIANLTVRDVKAFNTTYLQELIDRLRMMLDDYQSMLDNLFFLLQWGKPFILLVTDQDVYPLGETVRISGYIYYDPNPQIGKPVEIWKDGVLFDTTITGNNGVFFAYWRIPMDKVQLGYHNLTAQATVEGETLSNSTEILVIRIPTNLKFSLSAARYSPGDLIVATARLEDFKERTIQGRYVTYHFDDKYVDLITSANGLTELKMNASDFDWGRHTITVRFSGTEIYQPSENNTQHFDVNLNTSLSLELSANRVRRGENVAMKTTLYANSLYNNNSRPLPDRAVTIMFDGAVMATGLTGEDGRFIHVLNTSEVPAGTYIIKALFRSQEPKYEDALSGEQVLVVYEPSSGENGDDGSWWHQVTGNFIWLLLFILIIIVLAVLMLSRDTIQDAMKPAERRKEKIAVKGAIPRDEIQAEAEAAPSGYSPVSDEVSGVDFSSMQPRAAIVKRYEILMETLKIIRKIPIKANMTAREIGEMLVRRGYPENETAKLTIGFEKAMYSARQATSADWDKFSALADSIQDYSGGAR